MSLSDNAVWSALKSPIRFQLFEAVRTSPGADARSLAEVLDASAPKLYYHLKILEHAGLLYADGGAGRKRSRGPEAAVYRACCVEFPAGFFDADAKAASRAQKLRRILADAGLDLALPKAGLPAGAWFHMRREHLTAREESAVRGHLAEVERILAGARMRRRGDRTLVAATALVGTIIVPLERGSLPDAPVE
ncbi:MAG: helix-turn-helix domain-containing protein [Planctomycetota bacterium]